MTAKELAEKYKEQGYIDVDSYCNGSMVEEFKIIIKALEQYSNNR